MASSGSSTTRAPTRAATSAALSAAKSLITTTRAPLIRVASASAWNPPITPTPGTATRRSDVPCACPDSATVHLDEPVPQVDVGVAAGLQVGPGALGDRQGGVGRRRGEGLRRGP